MFIIKAEDFIMKILSVNDMADADSKATGVYRMELQSLLMIQYYDATAKQLKKANTETSCVRSGGSVRIEIIEDGFIAYYDFTKIGFLIPLRITIDKNGLNAFVDCTKVEEAYPDKFTLYSLSVLPYFGAGSADENGYIMIADGCGAIMNFNNGKYSKLGYSSHVYGRDISKYLIAKPSSGYAIAMPVFGIKKEQSAICAIVSEGAAQATFWSYPNDAITSYANVYSSFDLRETDIVVLNETASHVSQSTLYQKGSFAIDKIEIMYRSIVGENADYNGMANAYKQYLIDRDSLKLQNQNIGKLSLDFYCSVKKKKSLLGFPVTVNSALSKFEDIEEIVKSLNEDGLNDVSITLNNWSKEQLQGKIDYSLKPISSVGNKKALNSLISTIKELKNSIYLKVNLNSFQKSGKNYLKWFHSARSMSNAPISDYQFYVSTSYKNKNLAKTSYLIPSLVSKMADNIDKKQNKVYENANIALGGISTKLYSDFNKKDIKNLEATKNEVQKAIEIFGTASMDFPADYVLKYTKLAQHIPTTSTRSDIFDKDIPFVQIVLSGIVPYTTEAINKSENIKTKVLEAAATGSCLQFDLITEDADTIIGTEFDELYNANSEILYNEISEYAKYFIQLEKNIGQGYIVSYENEGNISKTVYSNDSVVIVNWFDYTVKVLNKSGNEYSFSIK